MTLNSRGKVTMTNTKISKSVAKELAIGFSVGGISAYVSNHLDEYKAFLAKNGYIDNTIVDNNSEAKDEQRKCG